MNFFILHTDEQKFFSKFIAVIKLRYLCELRVKSFIFVPLGHKAREKNSEFQKSYAQMINKFTKQFANDYCNDDGTIEWEKLVQFNSGVKKKQNI